MDFWKKSGRFQKAARGGAEKRKNMPAEGFSGGLRQIFPFSLIGALPRVLQQLAGRNLRQAVPFFLVCAAISCASSAKKRKRGRTAEGLKLPLTLSESLSRSGGMQDQIEGELAGKYRFGRNFNEPGGKKSLGQEKIKRGRFVAGRRSLDFGDAELIISERSRDEVLEDESVYARRRGLSSTKKRKPFPESRPPLSSPPVWSGYAEKDEAGLSDLEPYSPPPPAPEL